MVKRVFLYFGTVFFSLGIIVYLSLCLSESADSELRMLAIILSVLFSIFDFLCIRKLIIDKKNLKNSYNRTFQQNQQNRPSQNQPTNFQYTFNNQQQSFYQNPTQTFDNSQIVSSLQVEIARLQQKCNEAGAEIARLQQKCNEAEMETALLKSKFTPEMLEVDTLEKKKTSLQAELQNLDAQIAENNKITNDIISKNTELKEEYNKQTEKLQKNIASLEKKLKKEKELYTAVTYSINTYFDYDPNLEKCKLPEYMSSFYDELAPTVTLQIHSMDVKNLNKAYRDNDKQITDLLNQYHDRYTNKTNKAIYSLIVIGLRSELQNILTNLKYDKLDNAIEQIKAVTSKYLAIAGEGNQTISATLTKFIGTTEYLFINAAKIEYDYYIKKEQARQEQIAIKEKMRQEAQERKALEEEKKKIESEEKKYLEEIEKVKRQLLEAAENEKAAYNAKILELQSQLSDVLVKKDTITTLQNGKAGNIYIISNLGSFGENIFKIGMTRRLDPQERVDELGSASVPFKFDVHSFIFSQDAVALENELHKRLDAQRVNKVNRRKEFFNASVDELAQLVAEIDPTAEFNKTMVAEEYRLSISAKDASEYSFDISVTEDIEEFAEA